MKNCSKCKQEKADSEFYVDSHNGRLRSQCKECSYTYQKPFVASDDTRAKARAAKDRNPTITMLHQAKTSAKKKRLDFDLEKSDIVIPDSCPVLGIPLFFTHGKRTDNTPSVDRIDNSKGYIKGNIAVISWKANQLKRDLTIETLEAILKYMKTT